MTRREADASTRGSSPSGLEEARGDERFEVHGAVSSDERLEFPPRVFQRAESEALGDVAHLDLRGGNLIRGGAEHFHLDDDVAEARTPVEVQLGDIEDAGIENASMVVLNYTLQFLQPDRREALLRRAHDGLLRGGILLLSEKVVDEDPRLEELLVDLHHEHKRRNNYSALEISRKRAALENVLIPETVGAHRDRLARVGFPNSAVWLRCFNFVSIVAIRGT